MRRTKCFLLAVSLVYAVGCNQDSRSPGFGLEDTGVDTEDTSTVDRDVGDTGGRDIFEPQGPPCWPMRGANSAKSRESICAGPNRLWGSRELARLADRRLESERVGWRGDLYALSSVSDPDNEGNIWVAEYRPDGQEVRVRISAYSHNGALKRRKTFSDAYERLVGFLNMGDALTVHLKLTEDSVEKQRLFELSEDGITRVATFSGVAGQLCAGGGQLYHMSIPEDFGESQQARPSLKIRSSTDPGSVVEERELSDVTEITDEPVGPGGDGTRCRLLNETVALFPASSGQRFSNWACFASDMQGAPVECLQVAESMSPNVVPVTPSLIWGPADSMIDIGPSGTPSKRASPIEVKSTYRMTSDSTLVRELRGILYGVAPDDISVIRAFSNSVREAGRMQVIDDENAEIKEIIPGQRQLFVIAEGTTSDNNGTFIHSVYDESGEE